MEMSQNLGQPNTSEKGIGFLLSSSILKDFGAALIHTLPQRTPVVSKGVDQGREWRKNMGYPKRLQN